MFRVGDEATIAVGMWVHSQTPTQLVMDKWTKVMILKPVKVVIEGVGDDGWLMLLDKSSLVRYKAWPTVLEQP
jgi:hypothetical protein